MIHSVPTAFGNPGVIHSVPTAFMNAVGTEWITPGLLSRAFIWDFGRLHFPLHLGIYIKEIGKITTKINEIGKIKVIYGLGMTRYTAVKMAK